MTEYIKRVYGVPGIPVTGPEDYSSLEPVGKRVRCPALVMKVSNDNRVSGVPCSGSLESNGWCKEHRYNALLLKLGYELGYPHITKELGALGIGATLAGWEAYAEIASPRSLKRILPIIKSMVDKASVAA